MMVSIAILAALASAATQAIAHALMKSGRDVLIVRVWIGMTGALVMAPICLFVCPPSTELLPWLLSSNIIHAIYQLVLVRAYGDQEFSVAYPMARGIGPLATSLFGVIFLGDRLTLLGTIGVCTVTAGLMAIALSRSPNRTNLRAAALAGVLTTAYTLIDAKAVRLAADPWTFIAWFFVLDGLIMLTIAYIVRGRRIGSLIQNEGVLGLSAGLTALFTYAAVLLVLRVLPAGAVSALRETSVVFAAIISGIFLKEVLISKRVLGTLMVAGGGVLVVLGLIQH
jgi:drug/metabolite transporter (DMT)-like permease